MVLPGRIKDFPGTDPQKRKLRSGVNLVAVAEAHIFVENAPEL